MQDGAHTLLFSFYIDGMNVETGTRTLPPPKELRRASHGGLELVSFHRWKDKRVSRHVLGNQTFRARLDNPTASQETRDGGLWFSCRSGYELYTVPEDEGSWTWEGQFQVLSQGRCGLVFGLDDQLNGYFISIDAHRGFTQIRAWGTKPERIFQNYIYEDLQLATFPPNAEGRYAFSLIRWGSYLELSIDGIVRLTLVDARFKGRNLGIYVESAEVILAEAVLHRLEPPRNDLE